jgi:hypothetical protein
LSNIIRGLSFIPGNERILARHCGLLRLLGKFLALFVHDDDKQPNDLFGANKKDMQEQFMGFAKIKTEPESEKNEEKADANEDPAKNSHTMVGDVAAMFLLKSGSDQKPVCVPEEDGFERILLETANHLREDAFVILSHLSVQLDLFDMNSEISYPIFDALLHWAVSTNLQARDPLLPGIISPRDYALEILCKMSVIERNVDLMLSTGTWPRIEELVRVLCSLISMNEEVPCSEFAIVILNAVCAASEAAWFCVYFCLSLQQLRTKF